MKDKSSWSLSGGLPPPRTPRLAPPARTASPGGPPPLQRTRDAMGGSPGGSSPPGEAARAGGTSR
eukprot:5113263-Alexandrium_andersonii.AAC.1